MNNWYLLQYKPNAHSVALRNLHRQGFDTFLPMQEITGRKTTKFVQVLRPLFPGYMFVAVELDTIPWQKINSTLGVTRLISVDGKPKALPPDLVSALMLRCDKTGKILSSNQLEAGEKVQVLKGPFANFIAVVEKIDAAQRIWVLMDFMGQSTRVSIKPNQLKISR